MRYPTILAAVFAIAAAAMPASAQEVEHYTVYCAANHIEISFWDLAQMQVRRGSNVCQFASYTSSSSAMSFAEKNFGGEGKDCSC